MEQLVKTTYLEMSDPAQAPTFHGERRLELRKAEIPSPELSRFFYMVVGAEWWWYSRLAWSRKQWQAHLDRPEVETWLALLEGTPAGYFELDRQTNGQVEIVYFGLLPSFIGRGLGLELLSSAIDCAWQGGESVASRVWLHTCTLDHPRALPNYQAQGFVIYETEEKIEDLPEDPVRFWPSVNPRA